MRLSLLTSLGVLAIAATTYAAPSKAHEAWASGSLDRVDTTTHSIVVKQGTHEMTFTLAPGAHMTQGKKTLQPSDLSSDIGRHVKVRYTENGATRFADRIEVAEATAAHAPQAQAKK